MRINEKKDSKIVELDDLICVFIDWYYKTKLEDIGIPKEEHHLIRKLKDFIENMALWYEQKYPYPDIYFSDNPELLQKFEDMKQNENIDWEEHYSIDTFMKTSRFSYLSFIRLLEVIGHDAGIVVKLTFDGFIKKSWGFWHFKPYIDDDFINENFNGKHISTLIELFEKLAKENPDNQILNHYNSFLIKEYNYLYHFREGLLNSVMYKIIERDRRIYRALLFAKEFNLNVDIPMKYAINLDDCSASELSKYIEEYINLGGHKDLVCFTNYFSRKSKYEKLETMTIEEINNMADKKRKIKNIRI